MSGLSRRQFVVGAAGAGLLAGCGRLPWQAPRAKLARIGFLATFGASFESSPNVEALRSGLQQYGWVEGQNLAIEWRFAEGDFSRLPALAAELVTSSLPAQLAVVRTVNAAFEVPLDEGIRYEALQEQGLFEKGEAAEGIRAFIAKRPPNFRVSSRGTPSRPSQGVHR